MRLDPLFARIGDYLGEQQVILDSRPSAESRKTQINLSMVLGIGIQLLLDHFLEGTFEPLSVLF